MSHLFLRLRGSRANFEVWAFILLDLHRYVHKVPSFSSYTDTLNFSRCFHETKISQFLNKYFPWEKNKKKLSVKVNCFVFLLNRKFDAVCPINNSSLSGSQVSDLNLVSRHYHKIHFQKKNQRFNHELWETLCSHINKIISLPTPMSGCIASLTVSFCSIYHHMIFWWFVSSSSFVFLTVWPLNQSPTVAQRNPKERVGRNSFSGC